MPESIRYIPSTLRTGDTLRVDFPPPDSPEGEDWATVQLFLTQVQPSGRFERKEFNSTAADVADGSEIELSSSYTANIPDGVYRYQVRFSTAGDTPYIQTAESGVIDVINTLDPRSSYNERMVHILEATIEQKLTGRGDVIEYELDNGMKIVSMSLSELEKMLNQYRVKLNMERGRTQYFV